MAFFDFFKPKSRSVTARPNSAPLVDQAVMSEYGLRIGMWVVGADDRVGILTGVGPDGTAIVMLVQEDGTNLMEVLELGLVNAQQSVSAPTLRQATREDIPLSRRPDVASATQFGYL